MDINYNDVHWRNTELLCHFLNPASLIQGRRQTHLRLHVHKKVAKSIKIARVMLLLPHIGNLKPTDKKSLRTLQEDIEDFTRKAVNLETGHIYLKHPEN